jgi:hypothetical protein
MSAAAANIFCGRFAEAAFLACNCTVAKNATMQLHAIDEKQLSAGVFR